MSNLNNYETAGESKIADLLVRSDLTYLASDETNVVVERSQKKQFSQKPEYKQEKIIIINLNTGNDFVSFVDSSLKFKLDFLKSTVGDDVLNVTFGAGSILNLFSNIKLVSRSGVVLTEINSLHLWNYYNLKMKHTYEWRKEQLGKILLGVGENLTSGTEWIVPLNLLCPFFDMATLGPASLCSGLRVELTLSPVASAFVDPTLVVADRISSYSVSDIELILDTYRLSSGAVDSLNQIAASSGMVMTFYDVDNSPFEKQTGQTNFAGEIRQTVSMANVAWACVRNAANTSNLGTDSLASVALTDANNYKYRIGSVYLPQENVQGPKQYYHQMAYATSALKYGKELGIRSGDEFEKTNVAIADMNRYWTSNTGVAINSSTTLNLTMGGMVLNDKNDIDVFLMHTRSINIFLENIVVRE